MVLFPMDLGSEDYGHLGYVTKYTGWKRLAIALRRWTSELDPTLIRIFGCSEDPIGDSEDYDFPINYWG